MFVKVANTPLELDASTVSEFPDVPKPPFFKVGDKQPPLRGWLFDEETSINEEPNKPGACMYFFGAALGHGEVLWVSFDSKSKHDAVISAIVIRSGNRFNCVNATSHPFCKARSWSWFLEKQMARYKHIDIPRFLAVDLQRQLMLGIFEYAPNRLLDKELDLSGFDARFNNEVSVTAW